MGSAAVNRECTACRGAAPVPASAEPVGHLAAAMKTGAPVKHDMSIVAASAQMGYACRDACHSRHQNHRAAHSCAEG